MSLYLSIASVLLLGLLVSCASTPGSRPAPPSSVEELFAADRAFCAQVEAEGLDAWVAWFDTNACKVSWEGTVPQGRAAIREVSAPIFADPDARLLWEPEVGAVIVPGELGFTRGPYRFVRLGPDGETVLGRGTYLTVWRFVDGAWRVALDTGVEADG